LTHRAGRISRIRAMSTGSRAGGVREEVFFLCPLRPFLPGAAGCNGPASAGETGRGLRIQGEWKDDALVRLRLDIATGAEQTGRSCLARAVAAILAGKGDPDAVPHKTAGTPFQKAVWAAVSRIPFGETRSYGEIAEEIDCRSPRAVGQALKANPLPIIIPCHRVVGKKGGLTGFACGLEVKMLLLDIEATQRIEGR
jgi:O-6-methylguanine DNA methyltransferase